MNKTDIAYITNRVKDIKWCTRGKIFAAYEKAQQVSDFTDRQKHELVSIGLAQLKPYNSANNNISWVHQYDFPLTEELKENRKINKRLSAKYDEQVEELELACKRLIDDCVLGVIDKTKVPQHLERISMMFEVQQ